MKIIQTSKAFRKSNSDGEVQGNERQNIYRRQFKLVQLLLTQPLVTSYLV